jgi:hypothetical protein
MTWQFDVNNAVLSANDVGISFWLLKELGVLHSRLEVLGSGDGIAAFENSGQTAGPNYDVLTVTPTVWNAALANSWSNIKSWMRLRMVDTTLEFKIIRQQSSSGSYEDDYQVWISPTGFTSGGASAILAPTATDEEIVLGTAPAGYSVFGSYNADSQIHIGIQDAKESGNFSSFYLAIVNDTTNAITGIWVFDALTQTITGDTQPWVNFIVGATPVFTTVVGGSYANAYRDYGGGSELFFDAKGYYLFDGSNRLFPGKVDPSPEDSHSRSFPVIWGYPTNNNYKGISITMQWKGVDSRDYPSTAELASANAKIYLDDLMLPWETGTVPL